MPSSNSNATVALVLGIVSMVSCGPFLGIPAIIVGRKARREIKASNGRQSGDGMALAGVILGWVATLFTGLILLLIVVLAFVGGESESRFEVQCNNFDEYEYNDC